MPALGLTGMVEDSRSEQRRFTVSYVLYPLPVRGGHANSTLLHRDPPGTVRVMT